MGGTSTTLRAQEPCACTSSLDTQQNGDVLKTEESQEVVGVQQTGQVLEVPAIPTRDEAHKEEDPQLELVALQHGAPLTSQLHVLAQTQRQVVSSRTGSLSGAVARQVAQSKRMTLRQAWERLSEIKKAEERAALHEKRQYHMQECNRLRQRGAKVLEPQNSRCIQLAEMSQNDEFNALTVQDSKQNGHNCLGRIARLSGYSRKGDSERLLLGMPKKRGWSACGISREDEQLFLPIRSSVGSNKQTPVGSNKRTGTPRAGNGSGGKSTQSPDQRLRWR